MANNQFEKYSSIPQEKFAFAAQGTNIHDQKLDTKPIGYFRDAFNRFKKNKASLVAAIIILLLVVYAIIGPFCFDPAYQEAYKTEIMLKNFKELPPRLAFMKGTGIWDGSKVEELTRTQLYHYEGLTAETGHEVIVDIVGEHTVTDLFGKEKTLYDVRLDQYYKIGIITKTMTYSDYKAIQDWQEENGIQVIFPWVDSTNCPIFTSVPDYWFQCDQRGNPVLDDDGNFIPSYAKTGKDDYDSTRLANDPANNGEKGWDYAKRGGAAGTYNYTVRLSAYNYFVYKFGYEPSFAFGTDSSGYDIFSRLASGARFSFILAIIVSVINLTIGALYGAIEGYYGGVVDIAMERFSDILSGVPFTVVTVLFQLHLAAKVGVVGSLIFAFVLTGWIGMASRVRMQFYRFKNQEYVLAARTLGASDWRIIWKHIFPNSLGTIITGSILVIPGVIFSETSLSYLGIINLDSATMSSVGTMLSLGQKVMTSSPHVVLFPALFIALLEISFNLFGNGLRDAFNPSLRGSEE